jgi:hypothetical protein
MMVVSLREGRKESITNGNEPSESPSACAGHRGAPPCFCKPFSKATHGKKKKKKKKKKEGERIVWWAKSRTEKDQQEDERREGESEEERGAKRRGKERRREDKRAESKRKMKDREEGVEGNNNRKSKKERR